MSTESPDSFWTSQTQTQPQTRPSTASSVSSRPGSKSRSKSTSGNKARLMAHVLTNRKAFEDRSERTPPTPMSYPRSPIAVQAVERGRPLAQASSWSSLRFTRKSSKDSLREDSQDAAGSRNRTIRRFQSLGFLRKKGSSISVVPSSSSTSLTSGPSKPSSSSQDGHITTNSNSNGSIQRQPHTTQVPVGVQVKQHVIPASTVFPGSTFTLTLTPGDAPPSSIGNAAAVPSFTRSQRANPGIRRSISLYEHATAKDLSDLTASAQRFGKRRVSPLPPTKTTTVARAPCAYDVTTLRSVRPRSLSLPLSPVLASREEHVATSTATGIKSLAAAPLNTSTSDPLLSTMSSASSPPSDRAIPQRAQHRFAAVYRPPPPVDANGYARHGHPKPALSLSMPSGVSIIEPLSPPAPALAMLRTRDNSPSSPYSAKSSSRPPPKAPIPVSPGASPDMKTVAFPPASRSFGSPSSISVPSGNHCSRSRTPSAIKPPAIISNTTPDNGVLELNYNIKAATSWRLANMSQALGGNGPSSYNSNIPASSDRNIGNLPRTVYSASPSIPINSRRRPSLPLNPTLQEQAEQSTDQADQLWGYFERRGLASSGPQSRSANGSPFTQTVHLSPQVHTPQTPSYLRTPPLTGGMSPISPFPTRPLATQRPVATENVDGLTTRPTQTQPPQRPERVRPTHLISQSSSAALPSPQPLQSFFPSPAPTSVYSPFPSPGVTLPVTPVTPVWTTPSTDANSVIPTLTPKEKVDRWLVSSQ